MIEICKKCGALRDEEINLLYPDISCQEHEWGKSCADAKITINQFDESVINKKHAKEILKNAEKHMKIVHGLIEKYFSGREEQQVIKFITSEQKNELLFCSVPENQFFINNEGSLCQKYYEDEYIVIADKDGKPYCFHVVDVYSNTPIQKMLPYVTKIEF